MVLLAILLTFVPNPWRSILIVPLIILLGLIVYFFREPERSVHEVDDRSVLAPADGKVVVIEEVYEPEFFMEKRLQISIFMSPLNVHINWNAIGGKVVYHKYHPGKYLVAWHPKSSLENERTTTVVEGNKHTILVRQIAGAVARRIINYLHPGDQVTQGQEMGFIRFGSRVDVLLPLSAEVQVETGQKVTGNRTLLAKLA